MCGIAGLILQSDTELLEANLDVMLDALHHRGPDDQGTFISSPLLASDPVSGSHVGLGHRRLSIIDIGESGHQPMTTQAGRYAIVFNGEIYNYQELRTELQAQGCEFLTASDTEVLLQSCICWGVEVAAKRFVGMFAFAFLDQEKRELVLGRDAFGIKPLYYRIDEEGLVFASETGALLKGVDRHQPVNARRLHEYLVSANTDYGEQTLFADIKQLPAAHLLRLNIDTVTAAAPLRYWSLDTSLQSSLSFDEAADQLRELLFDSVRLHLRSDAPIGFALSGGLDSSAIVMIARKILGKNADIHSFSYLASDERMSERRYIDCVQEAANTIPHTYTDQADDLPATLNALSLSQGEPTSYPLMVQKQLFDEASKAGFKVLLMGQGADEMLAGYDRFVPSRLASLLRQGRYAKSYDYASKNSGVGWKSTIKMYLSALSRMYPLIPDAVLTAVAPSQIDSKDWLVDDWFRQRQVEMQPSWHTRADRVLRDHLLHGITQYYLPTLLRYDDRNAMAASVENRVPFLNPALVEFLFSLPEEYLLDQSGTRKAILRHALRDLLPPMILQRRDKMGFGMPVNTWLQQLRPWIEELMIDSSHVPFIDTEGLQNLWQLAQQGRMDATGPIWRVILLNLWVKQFNVSFE